MEKERTSEAGIDALENLAYLIAEMMIHEIKLQAGNEMVKTLIAAEPAKLKVRTAGGAGP